MIRKAIFSILSIFLICSGNCMAVEIIPAQNNEKSYYERTVDYSIENPEWGVIIIGTNQYFKGDNNQYSNYKYDSEGHLLIYDVDSKNIMKVTDFDHDLFYHTFESGEQVPIYWSFLTDNVLFIAE